MKKNTLVFYLLGAAVVGLSVLISPAVHASCDTNTGICETSDSLLEDPESPNEVGDVDEVDLTDVAADVDESDDSDETDSTEVSDVVNDSEDDSTAHISVASLQSMQVIVPAPIVQVAEAEEEGEAEITVTDDRTVVQAGEMLTCRMVVHNPFDRDLTGLDITSAVSSYLEPLGANPEAALSDDGETVTWSDQTVSALSDVTFAIQSRVRSGVPAGTPIRCAGDINGDGVRLHGEDVTTVESGGVQAPSGPVPQVPTSRPTPVTAKTGIDSLIVMGALGAVGEGTRRLIRIKKTFLK